MFYYILEQKVNNRSIIYHVLHEQEYDKIRTIL